MPSVRIAPAVFSVTQNGSNHGSAATAVRRNDAHAREPLRWLTRGSRVSERPGALKRAATPGRWAIRRAEREGQTRERVGL